MNLSKQITSPTVVVHTSILFIFAVAMIVCFFRLRTRTIDPRVTIEYTPISVNRQKATGQISIATTIDGEVARTAERISEATALALSASLYAVSEQLNDRTPRGARDLITGLAARNLLPPGIKLSGVEGNFVSADGSLSLRYRPTPLSIEVIALGHQPADGPALIVRVPDDSLAQNEAKLYLANSLGEVRVPAPFAPEAEVIALGWSPERWRSLK